MESETYQIIKYQPHFKNQLLNLQAHLWRKDDAVRAAYFEWKYNSNPYVDETYIYLGFYGKQLVGMVGAYGVQWESGDTGQSLPALCFADLIVLPDHRKGNLFQHLMTFALDDLAHTDYAYVFDLSAAPQVMLVLLMQGWRRVFIQTAQRYSQQSRNSLHPHDHAKEKSWVAFAYRQFTVYSQRAPLVSSIYKRLRGLIRALFPRLSDKARPAFAVLDDFANRGQPNSPVSVSKTPRPHAMAELVLRNGADCRIRHVRDEQYFNWRYQNPLSEYRFLFWDDGRFDGFLVLHSKPDIPEGAGCAYIVDWEVTNGQVWADLLQAVIHFGKFNELDIWSETLSDDMKVWLRKAGFTFLNKTGRVRHDSHGENILVKPIRPANQESMWVLNDQDLLDARNWDLRMIYSDAY